MTSVLGVFVKQPVPGRVKTRLAADVGPARAAAVYAAFVEDLLQRCRGIGDRRILAFAPDTPPARDWAGTQAAGQYELWAQPDGDLGQRMAAFFCHAFQTGARRVVLLGSDSPNLPLSTLAQAFDRLEEADVVIGPAADGGYYLVGQSGRARDVFQSTDWSTDRVFEQTVCQVRRDSATLGLLPVWYDVDTVAEARMLLGHLDAAELSGEPLLPKTAATLRSLLADHD